MIKKIDTQLELYDEKVGSSLNVIESNEKGQITLADLQRAMRVIKHAPPEEVIENLGKKLDVDQDGFVVSTSSRFWGEADVGRNLSTSLSWPRMRAWVLCSKRKRRRISWIEEQTSKMTRRI